MKSGVCAAQGFKANGVHCGIRANQSKNDLAVIYSEKMYGCWCLYNQCSKRSTNFSKSRSFERWKSTSGCSKQWKCEYL